MPAPTSVITVSGLTFAWPDGTPSSATSTSSSAPAGPAWSASTAPASPRCCASSPASCSPTAGHVTVAGEVGYLPQDLTLDVDQPVDDFLGIGPVRRAVRAVEAGDADQRLFDVIGDDWDVEDRAVAELGRLGLPADVLDRRLGELSGGEVTQLGLSRLLLQRPDVLLLDEPTNNLDAAARAAPLRPGRGLARARCWWSATTASCSSGWTGSATCAAAPCGGTAAATRRTPPRSRPSRRPPSRR